MTEQHATLLEQLNAGSDNVNHLARIAFAINCSNGFWEKRIRLIRLWEQANPGDTYALVDMVLAAIGLSHTELSEAAEAARKAPREHWNSMQKDSMVREFAGTVIRIMDVCEYLGLDLASGIRAELIDNASRGYMHGGKKA